MSSSTVASEKIWPLVRHNLKTVQDRMYVSNLVLITNRRSHMSSLLLRKSAVFILGTYKGNIPQKALYPPQKTLYQANVSYLCSEKLSAHYTPWTGDAPGPRWGTAPPLDPQQWCQSIGVHDVRTPPVFGRVVSKYYVQMWKSFSLWGLLHLDHTGNFRSSDPSAPLAASVYACVLVTTCLWLDDIDKNFGPDLPLLFKVHQICSVYSQENY